MKEIKGRRRGNLTGEHKRQWKKGKGVQHQKEMMGRKREKHFIILLMPSHTQLFLIVYGTMEQWKCQEQLLTPCHPVPKWTLNPETLPHFLGNTSGSADAGNENESRVFTCNRLIKTEDKMIYFFTIYARFLWILCMDLKTLGPDGGGAMWPRLKQGLDLKPRCRLFTAAQERGIGVNALLQNVRSGVAWCLSCSWCGRPIVHLTEDRLYCVRLQTAAIFIGS
ncbi:uncharacterized protein LOC132399677 [Hypanus sabinus]|uniref:uncharacterized protein LOC132399677 n=1 Tax=Hypanus sabinus TaxID=79690 RepID=UPI0028C50456|nr:uncharacterized protein LOC132399677 [Hypanus sabinus]